MGFLIAAACLYATWAVWVRRATIRPTTERLKFTEQSITTSLILQAAGLLLMSAASTDTLGRALHAITGKWNLDTWAGHCCYIPAVALIGVNVASRLSFTHSDIRTVFTRDFGRPMTVIVPIMLALLVASPNADREWSDFFECPLDGYLMAYWVLLCGFIAYLLARTSRGLLVLCEDHRSRRTAAIYLAACILGIAVCLSRVFTVGLNVDFARWFWLGDSVALIAFAHASAQSWRQRIHPQTDPSVKL